MPAASQVYFQKTFEELYCTVDEFLQDFMHNLDGSTAECLTLHSTSSNSFLLKTIFFPNLTSQQKFKQNTNNLEYQMFLNRKQIDIL